MNPTSCLLGSRFV
jgi:hypothetical protein